MTALIKVKNPSLITSERVICAVEGTQEEVCQETGTRPHREQRRGVGWAQHSASDAHDILPPCGITAGRPRLRRSPPALHLFFLAPSLCWLVNRDYSQRAEPGRRTGRWACDWLSDTLLRDQDKNTLLSAFLHCFSVSSSLVLMLFCHLHWAYYTY